jgi:hypothetical protein
MRRASVAVCLLRLMPVLVALALTPILVPGSATVFPYLLIMAVLLGPACLPRSVLYPDHGSPPDCRDADGGGGGTPPEPPMPPAAPRGGIPLPDADPARVRARDHLRRDLGPTRKRRATREPEHTPQRAQRQA